MREREGEGGRGGERERERKRKRWREDEEERNYWLKYDLLTEYNTHSNHSLLLHASWCVVEVSECHGNLVIDWSQLVLSDLQLSFKGTLIIWRQICMSACTDIQT